MESCQGQCISASASIQKMVAETQGTTNLQSAFKVTQDKYRLTTGSSGNPCSDMFSLKLISRENVRTLDYAADSTNLRGSTPGIGHANGQETQQIKVASTTPLDQKRAQPVKELESAQVSTKIQPGGKKLVGVADKEGKIRQASLESLNKQSISNAKLRDNLFIDNSPPEIGICEEQQSNNLAGVTYASAQTTLVETSKKATGPPPQAQNGGRWLQMLGNPLEQIMKWN